MPLGNKENCIELDYSGLSKMALVKSMNRVWKVEWLWREITMKKAIIMEQEQSLEGWVIMEGDYHEKGHNYGTRTGDYMEWEGKVTIGDLQKLYILNITKIL